MKLLPSILAACVAVSVAAQTQSFNVITAGTNPFSYGNSTNPAHFLDLTVTNAVTLRGIEVVCYDPTGTLGSIEIWRTTTAVTRVGNETIQANWTQLTAGPYTSTGFFGGTEVCQIPVSGDTELDPGTYGIAIVYNGLHEIFWGIPAGTGIYPESFSDANLAITNMCVQGLAWTSAPLQGAFSGGAYEGPGFDIIINYDVGSVPHSCSGIEYLGQGSVRSVASVHQRFEDLQGTATSLNGKSLLFTPLPSGDGYLVSQGTATVLPAPGTPTTPNGEIYFAAADDAEYQITPTTPFIYPLADGTGFGVATDFYVSTNGFVSTEPQTTQFSWVVDEQEPMSQPAQSWYGLFTDLNTAEVGSGQIWYMEVGTVLYVTFDGVEHFPDGTANPSRFQFQFDSSTGTVEIAYDTVTTVGGAQFVGQDSKYIGWSPAGPSPAAVAMDFDTLVGAPLIRTLPEEFELQLEVQNTPVVGGSIDVVTSSQPFTSVGLTAFDIATVAGAPVPLDLILGAAPGTGTWIDPVTAQLYLITDLPFGSMTLTVPIANLPTLAGVEIITQSFWMDLAQTANVFGNMRSSRAARITIGNY
ncbi:MAG: hypothetical protein R3F29_11125 [Planctomycetota bacterium]